MPSRSLELQFQMEIQIDPAMTSRAIGPLICPSGTFSPRGEGDDRKFTPNVSAARINEIFEGNIAAAPSHFREKVAEGRMRVFSTRAGT